MEPLDLSPDDEIKGTKYIVVRRLSSGGHGTIYLVRNRDLPAEKRFALKILSSHLSANADLNARLLREAHLQACIEHPNVVAVYDAGMTGESPPRAYLLMERLRGENLQVMISRAGPRGLGLAAILNIGIQVADALECAHERGAIHRDIKPDNIFVHRGVNEDAEAVTKVLDFGVAYFMGLVQRRTGEVVIGTPMYMTPEQFRGERPTPRTDIYALGLVLYEMVTGGKRPFKGKTLAEVADAHLHRRPPLPSSKVDVEVPHPLEQLIMQMLEKDPRDRPPNARHVGSKLREMKHEAELAYRGGSIHDINETEETPLENLMMATRAPETNPTTGHPDASNHTLPGTPRAKAIISAARSVDATEPGMDLPPLEPNTLEDAAGFATRRISPTGARPPATTSPRVAVTRSLPQDPPSRSRTDTEELRFAETPQVRQMGDRAVLVNDRSSASPRPAAGASTAAPSTASAGVLMRSTSEEPAIPFTRWRTGFVAAAGVALFVFALGVGVNYFARASAGKSAAPTGSTFPIAVGSTPLTATVTSSTSAIAPPSPVIAASAVATPSSEILPASASASPRAAAPTAPPQNQIQMKPWPTDLDRGNLLDPPPTPPRPSSSVPARALPITRPSSKPRNDGWDLISDTP